MCSIKQSILVGSVSMCRAPVRSLCSLHPCLHTTLHTVTHQESAWLLPFTGTSSTLTSSASANLTQISNLTNAWQLDPANLSQQFGLHIYGSGATTGLVVDSGADQVCLTPACCFSGCWQTRCWRFLSHIACLLLTLMAGVVNKHR